MRRQARFLLLNFPKKLSSFFENAIDKRYLPWYNTNVRERTDKNQPIANEKIKCWCGSMAEQLICNQQVVGSTPITSFRGNSRVAKGDRL